MKVLFFRLARSRCLKQPSPKRLSETNAKAERLGPKQEIEFTPDVSRAAPAIINKLWFLTLVVPLTSTYLWWPLREQSRQPWCVDAVALPIVASLGALEERINSVLQRLL